MTTDYMPGKQHNSTVYSYFLVVKDFQSQFSSFLLLLALIPYKWGRPCIRMLLCIRSNIRGGLSYFPLDSLLIYHCLGLMSGRCTPPMAILQTKERKSEKKINQNGTDKRLHFETWKKREIIEKRDLHPCSRKIGGLKA